MSIKTLAGSNLLLEALPETIRNQLLANCEEIGLVFADVLYCVGDKIPYVYFPIESFISLVMPIHDNAGLEVGLVGNEGMLGISLILGVDIAPFHTIVQGAGSALRIDSSFFIKAFDHSSELQHWMKKYLFVSMTQIAQTAACTRFHLVEARLARWLLMTQDRAHSDTFHVTHVFLSYILGVRRVGITKAANSLLKKEIISYRRGRITILDRPALEAVSCKCYQLNIDSYQHFMI
jgi:CRP-like cAMP-binding protein